MTNMIGYSSGLEHCRDPAYPTMAVEVKIQPRLQVESWSLYWKASLHTETQCLDSFALEVDPRTTSVKAVLEAAALKLGWTSVDSLLRLEGFNDPWERAIAKGKSSH